MEAERCTRVVIAGGSGAVGRSLARVLVAGGYAVTVLTRSTGRHPPVDGVRAVPWRGRAGGGGEDREWLREIDGALAVVNLAGRSVDCIKSPGNCDEILRSRVESTLAIGAAVGRVAVAPRAWVQMGTAHIYGDPPSAVCDESSPTGYGLAPAVGRAWEEAFWSVLPRGVRGVVLRTSFVLMREGGALAKLGLLARLGLGGRVGSGLQGISWIHERDMNRLFVRGIEHPGMQGVYVASAPGPVSNEVFMRALRRAVGMHMGIPSPAWCVRIGARLILRTDPELALCGRYVMPTRLLKEGFAFSFEDVGCALDDIYGRRVGTTAGGDKNSAGIGSSDPGAGAS